MDDPALVRVMHRVADLDHQLQPLPRVQLVLIGILDQRLAVDQFHCEERLHAEAGIRAARLVDLRDAGMLQPAKRLRLLLEPAQHLGAGPGGLNHLERDSAPRLVLLGLVDRAHPALAQQAHDAVTPDAGR